MRIINTETKIEYFIDLFKNSGEEKSTCPECSPDRKKKHIKCFSWNHAKEVGYCSHCGTTFAKFKEFVKEYDAPLFKNNTEVSDAALKWFKGRGINQMTLREMKITESKEWMPQEGKEVNTIQFNYFRNDKLVNVKYRDAKKNFKLHKGAELILYNYDNIINEETIILVEGEMDALSLIECGIRNVCSVPNGASEGNINLEYIDNCIEVFKDNTKIILATDADNPGINLRNELAARLGFENCYRVNFKDCKDANEYLLKYGVTELQELMSNPQEFPLEGVFTANDFRDEIYNLYENGMPPGLQIGLTEFDKLISFDFSRIYTWTGIPGHGKSELLDEIIVKLNVNHGLRAAVFSPENWPLELHASKYIEKLVGSELKKSTMSKIDLDQAIEHYNKSFYHIAPEDNFTVQSILSKAKHLVKSKGIKILVIDPYNTVEHKRDRGEMEHDYISRFMDTLRAFAKRHRIMIFLVAHPTKMSKDKQTGLLEVTTLYDISGSANFYNKTDFGISVYRNFITGLTEVYVQKVKFKHLGKVGMCQLSWNNNNGRYSQYDKRTESYVIDNSNYLNPEISEPIEENNLLSNIGEAAPF